MKITVKLPEETYSPELVKKKIESQLNSFVFDEDSDYAHPRLVGFLWGLNVMGVTVLLNDNISSRYLKKHFHEWNGEIEFITY